MMSKKFEIHGHDIEFEKNEGKAIIELQLGENPSECYLIDIFSVDGIDYIALVDSENSELIILLYELDDEETGEIRLNSLEDEEQLDQIYHLFSHYWDYDTIDKIVNEYEYDLENRDIDD
nr:DUF1292 domain-containing protein [Anaerococcus hydrogenalis]